MNARESIVTLDGGLDVASIADAGFRLPGRPYPGIRPFKLSEWPIFFGREVVIDDVIGRLQRDAMVVVHGASGCGKSSLVYAGVLPQLARRARQGRRKWRAAEMRPGNMPLRALAEALAGACRGNVDAMHRVIMKGRAAAPAIAEIVRDAGLDQLCLYVDQFEELFRFARHGSAEEAALFIDVLLGIGGEGLAPDSWWDPTFDASERAERETAEPRGANAIRVLLTMRSEFLGDCARFRGLPEMVNRTQYLLPSIQADDLERSISEPARLFGGSVTRELAGLLIREAAGEADSLPLVQHALMLLWRSNQPHLTLDGYHALLAGQTETDKPDAAANDCRTSLSRLLADHADEVLRTVDKAAEPATAAAGLAAPSAPSDDRTAESLFRALTEIDAEGRATRRPQPLAALLALVDGDRQPRMRALIDAFRAEGASFLRPYPDDKPSPLAGDQLIDISHEALFRAWPRLADATIDSKSGHPRGWLYRELEDGLLWRSLAVQARVFRDDADALLDPATTERRSVWFDAVGARAAWAGRHLIARVDATPPLSPEMQPEWQSVAALIAASRSERDRTLRRARTQKAIIAFVAVGVVLAIATVSVMLFWQAQAVAIARATEARARQVARQTAAITVLNEKLQQTQGELLEQAKAGTDFIWLGSDADPTILDAATGEPGKPSAGQIGQRFRLIRDLVVRSALPNRQSYAVAKGRGFLPKGSAFTLIAAPTPFTRPGGRQYWAPVDAATILFGTVYIQFTGGSDAASRSAAEANATALAGGLASFGYRLPAVERVDAARGRSEVRVYHAEDLQQAQVLASLVQRTARTAGLGTVVVGRVRDLSGAKQKTALGVIELWIDLDAAPAPVPARDAGDARAP